MKTTICGYYPKIDYKPSDINLRQTLNSLDTGKADRAEVERVIRETIRRTVDDQIACGIDTVTDGQIRWTDPVSPFCGNVENVVSGGLRRFFDNNVYYRRPQINGPMKRVKPLTTDDLSFAKSVSKAPVKAVMSGPLTFAAFSDDHHYGNFDKVVMAAAEIINQELKDIERLGVEFIQLDEPSLAEYPERFDLAVQAIKRAFDGIGTAKGIASYFNPLKSIIGRLGELPVDFVALDLVSHPDELGRLPRMSSVELHAGLIDTREVRLEDAAEVKARLKIATDAMKPSSVRLTTSCALEFVPRNFALEKMKRLSEIARTV
jgi:5-methyltetrahydropteroyltriglutamate--homocysteine methyltransferase